MTEQIGDQKTTASAAVASNTAIASKIGVGSKAGVGSKGAGATKTAGIGNTDGLSAPPTAPALETRHAVLRYTTLRLALFLVALLLVWGVAVVFNMDLSSQLSKLTLLAVALLLSSAASFIVLSKYRDAMSAGIVSRSQRLSSKLQDSASFEDEEDGA